jgi:SAM-dependent methyltransferase
MPDPEVLQQMRDDWNQRARDDARYYVTFGRRGQQDEEFFASAADVVRLLEDELPRLPRNIPPHDRRGLEVGCGPGRLMRPMNGNFGELHGVDVSDEMIRLAEERFRGASGMHLHATSGSDLAPLSADCFDFVYSYAMFRHIPSREVVVSYFDEIRRVLKTGGIARLHLNGLPPGSKAPDTWEGVRLSRDEIADYARDHDFQLLSLDGAGTPDMWTTWRKQAAGWRGRLQNPGAPSKIQRSANAHTGEPVVPASGRFAPVSFWIEQLPPDCDLNDLKIAFDGAPGTPCYIGPPEWGVLNQVRVLLPRGIRTGLVPVDLLWLGAPLCPPVWLRVIPSGLMVPRVCSVTDGANLLAGARIESGVVKLVMEDLEDAEVLSATVDGGPVEDLEWFPTDASAGRSEINFRLPADLAHGAHRIELRHGTRSFPPVTIEVV